MDAFFFWQEDGMHCQSCCIHCISSCTLQNEIFPWKAALTLTVFFLLSIIHFCNNGVCKDIPPKFLLYFGYPLLFFLLSLSVADMNSRTAGALILSGVFAERFVSVRVPCSCQTLPSDVCAFSHWFQWDSQPSEAPIWLLIFSILKNIDR